MMDCGNFAAGVGPCSLFVILSFNLNPPPLMEDPESFYRKDFFIFCHVPENEAKEHARVPRNPARRPTGR